jgi:CRP-like cAMP-binding protein
MTRKMTTVMMQSMRNTYGVLARRVTLFRGLDPEAVAKLFARGKTVEYDAGQVIFNKGELGRCMYVILSGSVDILDDGRLLAQLEQGENFGEMALLSNAARSASAQTATRTSLFVLSFADITHDLDKRTSVQLLVNITVTLSARLRRAQSL